MSLVDVSGSFSLLNGDFNFLVRNSYSTLQSLSKKAGTRAVVLATSIFTLNL